MILLSALAALAMAAAPQAAVEKTGPAATAATPALDAKSEVKTKKVCTESPPISGSRLAKRTCRTVKVEEKAPPAAGVKADPQ
ncbi:hypothetical protein [Phenylobacterium sp.]|jgi:hypothetical protein|uniref:hypothetical protein n=1 Tax=Phenylobacterium sp. TaxID=1871053 RepID=UPI002F9568AE